uniref:CCT-alpha n=1 Tax=Macrostomum lignano TaxID=282301 RepID=A0A1I8F9G1_9PLAT
MVSGERLTGRVRRHQNVVAAASIANIVKTSLGPVGLDKMLVDDVGDLLEVEHGPAAKILVELAQLQDEEVGDGTTSVVLVAAELLKNAEELMSLKIHPTTIISGYRLACRRGLISVDDLARDNIVNAAKTSMSSKIIGCDAGELFAAMGRRRRDGSAGRRCKGGHRYPPIKAVNAAQGMVPHCQTELKMRAFTTPERATVALPSRCPDRAPNAKNRLPRFLAAKVQDEAGHPAAPREQLELMRPARVRPHQGARAEEDHGVGRQRHPDHAGSIDDLCMKYFVEAAPWPFAGAAEDRLEAHRQGHRRPVLCLHDQLGGPECVAQESESRRRVISRSAASIGLLRGATISNCDEMERQRPRDALCVVKRGAGGRQLVPPAAAPWRSP